MEDSIETLPKLIDKITEFGNFVGFYINRQKSKIICKKHERQQKELKERVNCDVGTSPMEAMLRPHILEPNNIRSYKEILNKEGNIKIKKNLKK